MSLLKGGNIQNYPQRDKIGYYMKWRIQVLSNTRIIKSKKNSEMKFYLNDNLHQDDELLT